MKKSDYRLKEAKHEYKKNKNKLFYKQERDKIIKRLIDSPVPKMNLRVKICS